MVRACAPMVFTINRNAKNFPNYPSWCGDLTGDEAPIQIPNFEAAHWEKFSERKNYSCFKGPRLSAQKPRFSRVRMKKLAALLSFVIALDPLAVYALPPQCATAFRPSEPAPQNPYLGWVEQLEAMPDREALGKKIATLTRQFSRR